MATTAKTKVDDGNRSKVPVFTPLQVPTWQLLIKTYLMRYQSDYVLFEDPPELDEDELESFRTEEGKESRFPQVPTYHERETRKIWQG